MVPLHDPGARDARLVGAKAASLAQLIAAGLPVPDGFCVTATAYELMVDDPEIRRRTRALDGLDPADLAALAQAGEALRDLISARDVPGPLEAAVRAAVGALGSERVAVRSSATAEDLPDVSAAGQHETYLGVAAADVVAAVRACMAALFTDRAIAYRARHRIAHAEVALAVLVQRQVAADAAGVMFTADPQTGSRRVTVIEAIAGSGERLVGGEATGHDIRVDRATGAHTEEPGDVLATEQVTRLVHLGGRVERELLVPQDIEWALAAGELVVLQARPITGLFPLPEPAPADGRPHLYLSWGHLQAFAEAMPPLVTDVWSGFTNSAFRRAADAPMAAQAGGRIYIDLTPPLRIRPLRPLLVEQVSWMSEPAAAGLRAFLDHRGHELRRGPGTRPRRVAGLRSGAAFVPAGARLLLRMVGTFLRRPADPRRVQVAWERWAADAAAAIRSARDPVARVRGVFTADARQVRRLYPQLGPLAAAITAGAVLEGWFHDRPSEVNDIGAGFPYDVVTRMNLGLGDLADLARPRPAVAEALRSGLDLATIRTVEGGREFGSAFDRYLDEFGHRATGEIDLSRPRWREDPSPLLRVVAANLAAEAAGAHRARLRRLADGADAAAGRLAQRAGTGRLGALRRAAFRRLLRTYRGHIGLREHPKQGLAHLFATWREVLLDAGRRLAESGLLRRPADVWYLRRDELVAALRGARIDVDIDARRAQHARHSALTAPPLLTSDGDAPTGHIERDQAPEGALVGTPVSAGIAEGPARVIHDPTVATIAHGEILVTRSADPGWTPLFLNASGLVTEVGGRLSHGALVAREYGLPAVAAVPGATTEIATGQLLRVDGGNGTVEILH